MNIRIEFDGGTSCNIPRLGFGNGYGSYKIDNEPVHRCNFNRPMSCNAAECFTLEYAIRAIRDRGIDVSQTALVIVGDSQIILRRVTKPNGKISKKTTPVFQEALMRLRESLDGFKFVSVIWQPRLRSVATFGH